jgi:hypothetical protein
VLDRWLDWAIGRYRLVCFDYRYARGR